MNTISSRDTQQPRCLAARDNFGTVSKCPAGCLHVSIRHMSFRLCESEYRVLMEMLAEAAQQLAVSGAGKPRRGPADTRLNALDLCGL